MISDTGIVSKGQRVEERDSDGRERKERDGEGTEIRDGADTEMKVSPYKKKRK